MNKKHVLLIAPTGMGKTEAAVLPIFSRLLQDKEGKPEKLAKEQDQPGFKFIYITPLRALNRDMLKRLELWAEKLGLTIAVRHGDTTQYERAKMSKKPPEVLITTPETLQILFTGKRLRRHLMSVRYLVVDEIHELADDERGWQLAVALERLDALTGYKIQRIGLSATVGNPEEVGHFLGGVDRMVRVIQVKTPKKVDFKVEVPLVGEKDPDNAAFGPVTAEMGAAVRACKELIEQHTSSLLFVNTRDTAESFANIFSRAYPKLPVGIHHGSLSKEVRVNAEDTFKAGRLKGLICTSSLELGIDIGTVDLSIQYNSPRTVSRLIQRFGRAGHKMDQVSKGMMVTTDFDEVLEGLACIRLSQDKGAEDIRIRTDSMAVLANQLISITMQGEGPNKLPLEAIHSIYKRSWPYRNLTLEDVRGLANYLNDIRMFFYDKSDGAGEVSRSRRSREYFYANISMIPDERSFKVIDITTRKPVAQLDESFVATYLNPYASFIVKGASWRVVEVSNEEILVEPINDPGALPAWVGEDLPVPFEVSQQVGHFRRVIIEYVLDKRNKRDKDVKWVLKHLNKAGFELLSELAMRQANEEQTMAFDDNIVIERGLNTIVLNCCFGSRVNETLGQYLSSMVGSRLGAAVGMTSDPYRIILDIPEPVDPKTLEAYLNDVDAGDLPRLMELVLRNSEHVKWRFVHIGKKFGALRKELDTTMINIDKLIENYRYTPIYHETINKVMAEHLDIPNTQYVLNEVQSGNIKLVQSKISPIGRLGFRRTKDLLAPEREDRQILEALKRRLETQTLRLICLSCGSTRRVNVGRAKQDLRCMKCSSVLVAAVSLHDKDAEKAAKASRDGCKRTPEQEKTFRRLMTNANLVMEYGPQALLVLAAHGVGPDTAARILAKQYTEDVEIQMLREILEREINYMRTKRFWD